MWSYHNFTCHIGRVIRDFVGFCLSRACRGSFFSRESVFSVYFCKTAVSDIDAHGTASIVVTKKASFAYIGPSCV